MVIAYKFFPLISQGFVIDLLLLAENLDILEYVIYIEYILRLKKRTFPGKRCMVTLHVPSYRYSVASDDKTSDLDHDILLFVYSYTHQ